MKIKYLGTAAAEGWPALFCQCEACIKARKAGGRNIRTRSQAIVDDKLLIDFPPDTYLHVLYNGLDLARVQSCIITHDHSDHFYPEDMVMRGPVYAHLYPETCLTFYGTEKVGAKIKDIFEQEGLSQSERVTFKGITPFTSFTVEEYTVTPLRANHSVQSDPVIYMIGKGAKTLLYANDTGYFPDETWAYLEQKRPYFDFISLDCTCGLKDCRDGHMGIRTCTESKERLINMGCADEKTVFCLHHFSHNCLAGYDEMVPIAQQKGFLVSYDGMVVEL